MRAGRRASGGVSSFIRELQKQPLLLDIQNNLDYIKIE